MSKIFYADFPEQDTFFTNFTKNYPEADAGAIYPYLLFRRATTDLDVALDAFFSKYNLSVGRFSLLLLLNDSEAGLMPSELASQVGVTQATISGLINSLEKAELVTRQTHKKDGRAFVIMLTDKGRALYKDVAPNYFGRISELMSAFPNEERESMKEIMKKLVQRLPIMHK